MAKSKPQRNLQPAGQILAGLQAAVSQLIAAVGKQDWKRVELYAGNMRERVEQLARELDKKDLSPEIEEPPPPTDEEKDV